MTSESYLDFQLERSEKQITKGEASTVITRLNLILAELWPEGQDYTIQCIKILCTLSKAAIALKERELATLHIKRAALLVGELSEKEKVKKVKIATQLSELLLQIDELEQANYFAEITLQTLVDCIEEFEIDDIAEVLHRYANVVRFTGEMALAYLALTVATLVMQRVSGLETTIAVDTAMMTDLACKAVYPSPLSIVGQESLRRAA